MTRYGLHISLIFAASNLLNLCLHFLIIDLDYDFVFLFCVLFFVRFLSYIYVGC